MSHKAENAMSGLIQSLFGGSKSNSLFGSSGTATKTVAQPSISFMLFLGSVNDAQKISKEAEYKLFKSSAETWLKDLSQPSVSNGHICDVLVRALVAAIRGYIFPSLHIHAVKLTQVANIRHKKIGYLYLSVCMADNDLSLLVTNTLHKDIQHTDAMVLLAALSALPCILSAELPPQISQSLVNCLHHPMSLVRRRTCQVIYAGCASVWRLQCTSPHQSSADVNQDHPLLTARGIVSALLHLLSDPDPGVAIAATEALAALYQLSPSSLCSTRDSICCSAAHLLTQDINGSLPVQYKRPPSSGHLVQLSIIKALRRVSQCTPTPWCPPAPVTNVLSLILTQVLPNASLSLSMRSLEVILLSMELPQTPPGLKSSAMSLLLSYLKSSNLQLCYSAVHTLTHNWSVFCSAVTPGHLESVVQLLQSTACTPLRNAVLNLLTVMASSDNYKTVLATLLQHGTSLHHRKIAVILRDCADDPLWCCTALQHLITSPVQQLPQLSIALQRLILSGLDSNPSQELCTVALELVSKLLEQEKRPLSLLHLTFVATILKAINDLQQKKPSSNNNSSVSLEKINEIFVSVIESVPELSKDHKCVFQCLLAIGLRSTALRDKIIALMVRRKESTDFYCVSQSRDVLRWLHNESIAETVINEYKLIDMDRIDWTLPFLEEYITESLEKHDVMPYIPFSIAIGRKESRESNTFDTFRDKDEDHAAPGTPSAYNTPRLSINHSSCADSRKGLQPGADDCTVSVSSSIGPRDPAFHKHQTPRQNDADRVVKKKPGLLEAIICDPPPPISVSFDSPTSYSTDSQSQYLSYRDCSTPIFSTDGEDLKDADKSSVGVVSKFYGAPKLIWSIHGRVADGSKEDRSAGGEGVLVDEGIIEVGAEASEELQVSTGSVEESKSTAASVAKALYAGLGRK